MSDRPLQVFMGAKAAAQIAENGWQGRDIRLLLGASGGPKWLILGHLDRLLFGSFLPAADRPPLEAVGSSVGSWRHACLAQEDPVAAINRFEEIYVNFEYSEKPGPEEVSAASDTMLTYILGEGGAARIIEHSWLHTHIVTARGRGLTGSASAPLLATGMGLAALGNAVSRRLLRPSFQRVVFNSETAPALRYGDFNTLQVPLRDDTVVKALHASGAIPFLLTGERDISGAPRGQYWDGGIIDYHFDLRDFDTPGLLLYPHFRADTTPGWFDKFLPWRRRAPQGFDQLVLLSPSPGFIASLPQGKIPDRNDFTRMTPDARIEYWKICIERSRELAEDFARRIEDSDPLQDVTLLS